jgi:serine/arginine repetitive matrix protein 2
LTPPVQAVELDDEIRKDVMQSGAARAKQRRQQEEEERQKAQERARKKAAEIEAKMNEAKKSQVPLLL